jgi:UDP-glucose 4-epimerase
VDWSLFDGRRCLVTGGAGFIGCNLTRALVDAGAHVTVLDNFSVGQRAHLPSAPQLEVVEGDLQSVPGLEQLVLGAAYVFHLAAQVGNLKSIQDAVSDATANILGSVRLFQACRGRSDTKVIYSSSSAIFGEARAVPIDEHHPKAPASFYALSKFSAEQYALLANELWGVPTVCLRYFNVFGLPMEHNRDFHLFGPPEHRSSTDHLWRRRADPGLRLRR